MFFLFTQCFVRRLELSGFLAHFCIASTSEEEERLFKRLRSECYLFGRSGTDPLPHTPGDALWF